jgi:hypothetical protein
MKSMVLCGQHSSSWFNTDDYTSHSALGPASQAQTYPTQARPLSLYQTASLCRMR